MKRLAAFLVVTLVMLVSVLPTATDASGPTHITGGGTGTFDGVHTGSHFGMGVVLLGAGAAQGHFECNMAGNAPFAGLHIMAVQGQVSQGHVNANGSVSFSGDGSLNTNGKNQPVHFAVTVNAGGPGVGSLQLTVTSPGGAPIAAFPPEKVMTGGISIH